MYTCISSKPKQNGGKKKRNTNRIIQTDKQTNKGKGNQNPITRVKYKKRTIKPTHKLKQKGKEKREKKAYVPLARSSRKSAGFMGKDGEYPTESKYGMASLPFP